MNTSAFLKFLFLVVVMCYAFLFFIATGKGLFDECKNHFDCFDNNLPKCGTSGTCEACDDNFQCTGSNPFCISGVCEECFDHEDCSNSDLAKCGPTNICESCDNDSQCTSSLNRFCVSGICKECITHEDCSNDIVSKCSNSNTCETCDDNIQCSFLNPFCVRGICKDSPVSDVKKALIVTWLGESQIPQNALLHLKILISQYKRTHSIIFASTHYFIDNPYLYNYHTNFKKIVKFFDCENNFKEYIKNPFLEGKKQYDLYVKGADLVRHYLTGKFDALYIDMDFLPLKPMLEVDVLPKKCCNECDCLLETCKEDKGKIDAILYYSRGIYVTNERFKKKIRENLCNRWNYNPNDNFRIGANLVKYVVQENEFYNNITVYCANFDCFQSRCKSIGNSIEKKREYIRENTQRIIEKTHFIHVHRENINIPWQESIYLPMYEYLNAEKIDQDVILNVKKRKL